VSGEKTTKTVFRMLWAWNDEKEERWLAEQERSGWHLKTVRGFGYSFERAPASEVVYRLDFQSGPRESRKEYLALFQDSGWEHVGARGNWHYFRKGMTNGKAPEIFTDPASRVAKYQRAMAALGVMLALLVVVIAPKWPVPGAGDHWRPVDKVYATAFCLKFVVIAFFFYAIARLSMVISRLNKARKEGA